MADKTRVHPEHLLLSGVSADNHADELHARHTAADGRIETAQSGMPTMAAAAMGAKADKWQAVTAALHARIADHGHALHTSGVEFIETEQQNAQEINAVGLQSTDALRDL
jgi:uncharacterized protein YukE